MKSNYNKTPKIKISENNNDLKIGWENILTHLNEKLRAISGSNGVKLAIDTYQGVDDTEILLALKQMSPDKLYETKKVFKEEKLIAEMVFPFVTDDRIFGYMSNLEMNDFFDQPKLKELKEQIEKDSGSLKIIYGPGASLLVEADVTVYIDMARWEIQQRMRKDEISNLGVSNETVDIARRYKQSFFVDWRVMDRHKMKIFDKVDFFVDANKKGEPKMIEQSVLNAALKKATQQPFRVVPFFDPGPWGGQWMKEVMDLDRTEINFAWSFDCVPEENSLLLGFGDQTFETPAINLVLREAPQLLGDHVYDKFGAEFPIRFDFLDTMKGGNLSLQVHPDKDYIKEQFGMSYTQDESYYMMEAGNDAVVYLGLKNDVDPDEMIRELKVAQETGGDFDADKHVGKYEIKKHDHILIPSGTVHCSGKDSVVLEISATPYIFTFKLWDWGRLGLDNLPRPINIEHGEKVIDWSRREEFSQKELINKIEIVDEGDGWVEERTGLYPTVFIETRRHWFTGTVPHKNEDGVNILNLVEGEEAIVESPTGAFEPFVVHYAETFIVPASVTEYTIRPFGESEGKKLATVKAFVRK
ncbi:class I mannose-6-phosphate isomerase [Antarcticibacterium sp. 1MA-6-2]|uniref:class I mannose-6-phosphate isomerase n=1 Tax=Antarcticibacterium sp. 1MA-6-2 TaxID=2908210 RepID=UPI001F27AC53|nr:class I mannose-6-phosphate isomerase [Antarcticibacterium sp. 1MA-6-2]UJH90629.1 class I mannose-6-phosphate isomerase [Antarcticibacterium sp. 1MA-6-2]